MGTMMVFYFTGLAVAAVASAAQEVRNYIDILSRHSHLLRVGGARSPSPARREPRHHDFQEQAGLQVVLSSDISTALNSLSILRQSLCLSRYASRSQRDAVPRHSSCRHASCSWHDIPSCWLFYQQVRCFYSECGFLF